MSSLKFEIALVGVFLFRVRIDMVEFLSLWNVIARKFCDIVS